MEDYSLKGRTFREAAMGLAGAAGPILLGLDTYSLIRLPPAGGCQSRLADHR